MAVDAGTVLKKATPRKIARWLYERACHAIRAGAVHAARLHMQGDDALRRNPPLPPGSLEKTGFSWVIFTLQRVIHRG